MKIRPHNRITDNSISCFPGILCCFTFALFFSPATLCAQGSQVRQVSGKLRIAACQFPVSADIPANYIWIRNQVQEARQQGAVIVQFPECALSGYPGVDMKTLEGFGWDMLRVYMDSLLWLSQELDIWILVGSMHRLSEPNKPHNSLYLVSPRGVIADRYDKRFCTTTDLEYFTPGDHFVTFTINDIRCGLLICYDVRFPELYRGYSETGVQVIFQSFYNAREKKGNIHPEIMPLTARANAASNYFYMSLTNSSAPESWPCYFITPDGLVGKKLPENVPGILISDIDTSVKYYDAGGPFRQDAISGKLNSGVTVDDPRSKDRTGY